MSLPPGQSLIFTVCSLHYIVYVVYSTYCISALFIVGVIGVLCLLCVVLLLTHLIAWERWKALFSCRSKKHHLPNIEAERKKLHPLPYCDDP